MSLPEPKACAACASHMPFGRRHLCTLPIEAFGGLIDSPQDDDDNSYRDHDRDVEHIGTSCDLVRRQGEICGPAGKLWEPAA